MIAKETVLVLGAGASRPYGFPLGGELLGAILSWDMSPGSALSRALFPLGHQQATLREFRVQLQHSSAESIDSFLADRTDLIDLGKDFIAALLCHYENPSNLYPPNRSQHWYSHLWRLLKEGLPEIDSLALNRVRIVTFNYDRSLECFLFNAIRSTYQKSEEDSLSILQSLKIRHVYGTLGDFHYDGAAGRPYETAIDPDSLRKAASGLRIMAQHRDGDGGFDGVFEWLMAAERICFLGFGFDPLNLQRLKTAEVVAEKLRLQVAALPPFFATVYGLRPGEIERANRLVSGLDNFRMSLSGEDCLSALRTWPDLSYHRTN